MCAAHASEAMCAGAQAGSGERGQSQCLPRSFFALWFEKGLSPDLGLPLLDWRAS